jgi:hypothetical protein
VQSVTDNSVTVKTTAGKVVEVRLDEKTTYLRGTQTQQKSDMKVGDRVVIDATKTGNTLVAHQIKLGTAAKKTATSTGTAPK